LHQDSVRIAPLSPDDFTDEQKALVGDWHHLNFSRVLVQHPGMYRVFLPFLDKLIRGSALPALETVRFYAFEPSRSGAMSTRDTTMYRSHARPE
jgi:hypothetical protein